MDNFNPGKDQPDPWYWNDFKCWLQRQHSIGCNMFGLGVDDIGFVSYETNNIVKRDRKIIEKLRCCHAVEILQDPDDDPKCFVPLKEVCGSIDPDEQLAWSRQFFLPIEIYAKGKS